MAFWGKKRRQQPAPRPRDSMENVRRTSSLPSGVFRMCDEQVEEALSGPVADVFLDHMTANTPAPSGPEGVTEVRPGNQVSDEEIHAFLNAYANASPAPAPDVARYLDEERIWVLADLATTAADHPRELAARELREVVGRITGDTLGVDLLERLVAAIAPLDQGANACLLLDELLEASRESLARIADGDTDD